MENLKNIVSAFQQLVLRNSVSVIGPNDGRVPVTKNININH